MKPLATAAVTVLAALSIAACASDGLVDPSGTGHTVAHSTQPPPTVIPLFVIGDAEAHDVGDNVNFWGAQWWKNNAMSGDVGHGVAAFKGYVNITDNACGGTWRTRPGNSSNPPDAIDADIAVIVTSSVVKNGADIGGDIRQIVMVHQDGGYGPNPGHPGNGQVTSIVCPQ